MQVSIGSFFTKKCTSSKPICVLFFWAALILLGAFTPIDANAERKGEQNNNLKSIRIFDEEFYKYVDTDLKGLNYRYISSLEDLDSGDAAKLSYETLLFEAYLDFCVHGTGPKNIPIINRLSNLKFDLRKKTSDPIFLDYLVKTYGTRIPSFVDFYTENDQAIDKHNISEFLYRSYLDFILIGRSNFAKTLLSSINDLPIKKHLNLLLEFDLLDHSYAEIYQFIRKKFDGMKETQGYDYLHEELIYFSIYGEPPLSEEKVETFSKSLTKCRFLHLLNTTPYKESTFFGNIAKELDSGLILGELSKPDICAELTISYEDLKAILSIISEIIEESDRIFEEELLRSSKKESDGYKNNEFMEWVKIKIGDRQILPMDLKLFYPYIHPKTVARYNDVDFSSEDERRKVLTEIYFKYRMEKERKSDSAYQKWFLDKIGMRQIVPEDMIIMDPQFPPDHIKRYKKYQAHKGQVDRFLQFDLLNNSYKIYKKKINDEEISASTKRLENKAFNEWLQYKLKGRTLSIPILLEIASNDFYSKLYVETMTSSFSPRLSSEKKTSKC